MIAAGPAVTHYNPDLVPVLKLLRELGSAAGGARADGGEAGVPAVAEGTGSVNGCDRRRG